MTNQPPTRQAPPVAVAWPAVTDFAEAARLRDSLQGEAGHPYQVHPSGDGFVVVRAEASSDEHGPRHGTDGTQASVLLEFRPAWRVGWGKGLTALLAGGCPAGGAPCTPWPKPPDRSPGCAPGTH